MNEMQIVLNGSDLAQQLGIKESTVRKYCVLMQQEGYQFHMLPNGTRIFLGGDLEVFREIILLKNQNGIKLEDAVKTVISDIPVTTDTTTVDVSNTTDIVDITKLESFLETAVSKQLTTFQTQFTDSIKSIITEQNKTVLDELQQTKLELQKSQEEIASQQKYIKDSIQARDEKLMAAIRETTEKKKRRGVISVIKSIFS